MLGQSVSVRFHIFQKVKDDQEQQPPAFLFYTVHLCFIFRTVLKETTYMDSYQVQSHKRSFPARACYLSTLRQQDGPKLVSYMLNSC